MNSASRAPDTEMLHPIITLVSLRYLFSASIVLFVLLQPQITTATENFRNITIFSILREMPNNDPVRHVIQTSAVWSWSQIVPMQNILLFFEDDKSCSFMQNSYKNIRCQTLPPTNCFDITYNRPYIKCVFDLAQQHMQTPIQVFVNGDIMVDQSTFHSITFINDLFQDFLIVGCRRDYEIPRSLTNSDPEAILKDASIYGKLHPASAIDFIAFRTVLPIRMPSFLTGIYRWDNWLLSEILLKTNKTVIDITQSSRIVHLQAKDTENHEPIHHEQRHGATYNAELVKNVSANDYKLGIIYNAHKILVGDCREGQCQLKDNIHQNEQILIKQRADADRYIVVLAVNSGYMPLVWNWVS